MKIAFDWQGTLDIHENIFIMAKVLRNAGVEVIIVSAMPITMQGVREKEIEDNTDLPYVVVYHELDNYHQAAGMAKTKYLKDNNIDLIIDDFPEVCQIMKSEGITVLQIV